MNQLSKKRLTGILVLCLLTLLSLTTLSLVLADGDTRPATQAEKELNKTVLQTFAKAVPPGPEGWEKTGDSTEIKDIQYVPDIKLPLRVEYHIVWQDTKRIRTVDVQFQQELIKLAQKPGFTAEAVDDLQKKMSPRDVKVRIDIAANLTSQGIYEKVAPAAAIAGGLVYRSQGGYRSSDWNEGSTYVFFGKNWKMTSSSSSGTYIDFNPEKPMTSSPVVRNIVVRIQADPARGQQYIEKIDWEALKKLIQ